MFINEGLEKDLRDKGIHCFLGNGAILLIQLIVGKHPQQIMKCVEIPEHPITVEWALDHLKPLMVQRISLNNSKVVVTHQDDKIEINSYQRDSDNKLSTSTSNLNKEDTRKLIDFFKSLNEPL